MKITKNFNSCKVHAIIASILFCSFFTYTIFASDLSCPEQLVCSSDNDMASCHCQTNGENLVDWYPVIIEESHIYEGTYVFHNADVSRKLKEAGTKTDCYEEYTNPHADDKLICRYTKSTGLPNTKAEGNQWKVTAYYSTLHFYCGTTNYGTSLSACPLMERTLSSANKK